MSETATHAKDLPPTVAAFTAANSRTNPREVSELFTEDAVVVDDGNTYYGRASIASWRRRLAQSASYTKTFLSARPAGQTLEVLERVEGDFPGGRVNLLSTFTLDASGLIKSVRIAAVN